MRPFCTRSLIINFGCLTKTPPETAPKTNAESSACQLTNTSQTEPMGEERYRRRADLRMPSEIRESHELQV